MGRHYGRCALCGKECDLTFEHIPPRAAFNSTPARPVSGDKMIGDEDRMPWDTSGLRYDNLQSGMGKYTLCEDCNNNTGSWYGNTYVIIAQIIHSIISKPISQGVNGIGIKGVYPLRFIKQILSMFCSVNNIDDERINTLREFVLDKNTVGLDKRKYKLCMYLTNSHYMKYAPLSVLIRGFDGRLDHIESMAVSEITAYPLGFILYFDPSDTWEYDGVDITSFSDYGYDVEATIELPLCILEVNDFFPTYYRTKEEIIQTIDENNRRLEELECQIDKNSH